MRLWRLASLVAAVTLLVSQGEAWTPRPATQVRAGFPPGHMFKSVEVPRYRPDLLDPSRPPSNSAGRASGMATTSLFERGPSFSTPFSWARIALLENLDRSPRHRLRVQGEL